MDDTQGHLYLATNKRAFYRELIKQAYPEYNVRLIVVAKRGSGVDYRQSEESAAISCAQTSAIIDFDDERGLVEDV